MDDFAWMSQLTEAEREHLDTIGYKVATGRIDEDEARAALVAEGLTPEQAEQYINAVIEGSIE